jgi:RNA polymerase sigma-70 factor (ECF subfamily)
MSATERTLDALVLAGAAFDAPADTDLAIEEAVLRLFDQYQRPLTRYVCSFGLAGQDAEDVVQDTFVALFRHVRSGRDQRNLPGWLFRVAHNLALKQRRRQRTHWWPRPEVQDVRLRMDPAPNPEERLAEAEEQSRWSRIMEALPERDRQCVLLRAEGMKYREIASALGLSLGMVAKIMLRTMKRLGHVDVR